MVSPVWLARCSTCWNSLRTPTKGMTNRLFEQGQGAGMLHLHELWVLFRETERLWENWLITKTAFPSPRCDMPCCRPLIPERAVVTQHANACIQCTNLSINIVVPDPRLVRLVAPQPIPSRALPPESIPSIDSPVSPNSAKSTGL